MFIECQIENVRSGLQISYMCKSQTPSQEELEEIYLSLKVQIHKNFSNQTRHSCQSSINLLFNKSYNNKSRVHHWKTW